MLKKYYLAFFLLIYSLSAYSSSIWDDIAQCVTDLCNCDSKPKDEVWNKNPKYRPNVKLNPICAPWNKEAGRDSDNCLMKYEMPQPGIGFYHQYCAQKTSDSTFFDPKINIRAVSCNAFACWSKSTTLKWDGECVVWPGPYIIPLLRICARVAMPSVPPDELHKKAIPADPGYTKGIHLNEFGADVPDDLTMKDEQGNVLNFDKPKLCAYVDPGLVNILSEKGVNTDLLDWKPNSQPLHKTNTLHPVIAVLVWLFDEGTPNISKMLGTLLESTGADKVPNIKVFEVILKTIGQLIEKFHDLVKLLLEQIGSLNSVVEDEKLGCVEIPLGPYPPPYCPTLEFIIPTPTISPICSKKNADGKFKQISQDPCVVSRLNNNIINNVVRISLDNLVPLCKDANIDSPKTDQCVTITPYSLSPKDIHAKTEQRDTIKPCPDTTGSGFCVKTTIPLKCSVTAPDIGCQDGFRVVYGQKIGDTIKQYDYYVDDLVDCNSSDASGKTACQLVWGINTGEFIDVPLPFLPTEGPYDILSLKKTGISLQDNHNIAAPVVRNFAVAIARNTLPDPDITSSLPRDPKSICVSEDGELVGCVKRVLDGYVMKAYSCDNSPDPRLQCSTKKYFTPEFIAALEVLDKDGKKINSTSRVVAPLTVNTIPKLPPGTTEKVINLAGLQFSSFMAFISDDTSEYIAIPFSSSDTHLLNPLTRYGDYEEFQGNKIPIDRQTMRPMNAGRYLTGLEYKNGQYIHGGTHACLQPKDMVKCTPGNYPDSNPPQEANCVLTKLLETDIVDCDHFFSEVIMKRYSALRICNPDLKEGKNQPGCKVLESLDGEKQKNSVTIYQCKSVVCYENNIHPGTEICKISVDVKDRLVPDSFTPNSSGIPINQEGQNFVLTYRGGATAATLEGTLKSTPNYDIKNISQGTPNYNKKTQAIRDKTLLELGLCIPYPVPTCDAIPSPTSDSGNATWPETKIGQKATGVCQAGFVSAASLKRYCTSDAQHQKVEWETLPPDAGCQPIYLVNGLPLKFTRNASYPKFPHKEEYDKTTKIGTISVGDRAGAQNLDLTNNLVSPLCLSYDFDININALEYFTLGDSINNYFDGIYLLISLNNQIIYGATSTKDERLILDKTNILSRLIDGSNNIKICIKTKNSKNLKLTMKYKLK